MFGQREPFLYKLVPAVVNQMGGAFPELKVHPGKVAEMIRGEETDFLKTIERGLVQFEFAVGTAGNAALSKSNTHQCEIIGVSFGGGARTHNTEFGDIAYGSRISIKPTVINKAGEKTQLELHTNDPQLETKIHQFTDAPIEILGEDIFRLFTTYGFPPDLTRQMAQERGLTTDEAGFQKAIEAPEEKSKGKSAANQIGVNSPR